MNGGLWWDNRNANGIEIYAYGTSPVIISNSVIFGSGGHGYAIFDYDGCISTRYVNIWE